MTFFFEKTVKRMNDVPKAALKRSLNLLLLIFFVEQEE